MKHYRPLPEQIRNLANQKFTLGEIAKLLGTSRELVRSVALKSGITVSKGTTGNPNFGKPDFIARTAPQRIAGIRKARADKLASQPRSIPASVLNDPFGGYKILK